ncbi:salivary gland surface protein 1-like [Rhodnius prolixus]|uniref:salivary gland surface protein 1-like n=1 Tax=Rhodnius prolixus TaxID=13249 RepID=UPI003D18CB92
MDEDYSKYSFNLINSQKFLFKDKIKLYQAKFTNESTAQLYSIYSGILHCYHQNNGTWKTFSIKNDLLSTVQDVYFEDVLETGQHLLITKTAEGISFFQYEPNKLNLLNQDDNFHDLYGWSNPNNFIKFGHFYKETNKLGIMTKHGEYGIQFYAVMKNEIFSEETPIWMLETNVNIFDKFSDNQTNFYIAGLNPNGQDDIIVQTVNGLTVFKFTAENLLKQDITIACCNKISNLDDKLFFSNLTGQHYRDIVYFNSSGLFLHQYNPTFKSYRFLNYQPLFSLQKGWSADHMDTVKFLDVNFDGKDDMVFTGPQGISIVSYSNNGWHSILDNSHNSIQARNGKVVDVISYYDDLLLFIYYQNRLHVAKIEEVKDTSKQYYSQTTSPYKNTVNYTKPHVLPEVISLAEETDTIFLSDQLDYHSIIDSVDRTSGKLKFMLPLVDIPNIATKLKIYYDGMTSGILGFGWSLPQNLILLDHQSSIFFEDSKYYIAYQHILQELLYDSKDSTNNIYYFRLQKPFSGEEDKELKISYFKELQQWEVSSSRVTQIYGKVNNFQTDPIQWESTWKNWRGTGTSTKDQILLPTGWYLSEVRDTRGNALYYSYNSVNSTSAWGNSVTNEIYLKQVADGEGNKITFKYNKTEATVGKNKLTSELNTSLYLSGYTLNSAKYTQRINFVYTIKNNKRMLSAVIQKNDRPTLQFHYNRENELEKVIFPFSSQAEYVYKNLKLPESKQKLEPRILINSNYKVFYSNSYVILSYLNKYDKVELRIFDHSMSKELYSSSSLKVESALPILGKDSVKTYDVAGRNSYMVIILWYSNDKEVCLFHWRGDQLLKLPTIYNFSKDSIIKLGVDYIIVADRNSSPVIIEWEKKSLRWTSTELAAECTWKTSVLAASNRMFVIYDDQCLELGYRDEQQKWKFKVIQRIPKSISNILHTLNRFSLDGKVHDQLLNYSLNKILQINDNLILLSTWGSVGTQFYSTVHLFLLNSKYEIILQDHNAIFQDDIDNFSRELKDSNGNSFKCGYKLNNNKFEFQVTEYKGPAYDEIEKKKKEVMKEIDEINAPHEKKIEFKSQLYENVTKAHNENRRLLAENSGKQIILLDYAKYHASLISPVVTISDYKFNFTGAEWKYEKVPSQKGSSFPITLGKDYILEQENDHSSFKLYRQNSEGQKEDRYLKDLQVKHLNQILIRYPLYLAYQEDGQQAQVIEFSKKGEISKTYSLPFHEKLSPWSGYQGIITESGAGSDSLIYFMFRFLLGINDSLFNSVVSQTVVTYDNNITRQTGYDYNVFTATQIDNAHFYPESTFIPGNDRKSFGWVEETIHKNFTTKIVYNGKGDVIRTLNESFTEEKDDQEDSVNKRTTIFGKLNILPVARFFPYEISSGMVSYFGFEDYEENNNANGTNSKIWLFNETSVVKQMYSFTGKNYLHINSGEQLEGIFHLNDFNTTFVASTWIRPNFEIPQLGSNTPYLKIIVGDTVTKRGAGVLSEIKLQSSGWYYLESIINLNYIKLIMNGSETKGDNAAGNNSSKLKISVIVSPESNTSIDVDHVRFSPINCRYEATVYDTVTKYVTHKIQHNGLIKRYLYDKYQEKIATINEYGQLTEFRTYTKVSSIGAMLQPKANVLVQAESGFYEEFLPDGFFEHWKIDASGFQISPGQLKHVKQSSHTIQLLKYSINYKSYGIRLCYYLQTDSSFIQFNSTIQLLRLNESATLSLANKVQPIPLVGEILLLMEGSRLLIWIDGGLYVDSKIQLINVSPDSDFLLNLEVKGMVKLTEVMVFSSVNLGVTYFNGLGEKIQEIKVEDSDSAIVTEFLYDELGRQSITTKPKRITNNNSSPITAYYQNFVVNNNPYSDDSVWKSGKIKGGNAGNASIIGEYDYTQTIYLDNPLDEERIVGLPGEEFSINGPFCKHYDSKTNILFIENYYPVSKGYRYRTEYKPGGVSDVTVFDTKDNKVAWYLRVPNNKDILCTYYYDEGNRLVKLLPPLYHEKAATLYKFSLHNQTVANEEVALEKSLGTHVVYDANGNIKMKSTPDSGKIENIYDQNGLLKFVVYYSHEDERVVDNVLYFNYDGLYRLRSTGQLESPPPVSLLLDTIHNHTRNYQEFYYNDADAEPTLRGRIRRTITYNDDQPFIEELLFNEHQDAIKKTIIIPIEKDQQLFVEINKMYSRSKLKVVQYPVEFQNQPFILTYEYNKMGKIKEIGLEGNPSLFFSFTYNPSGQVVSETHYPTSVHSFTRSYSYNSPGFIVRLNDKFLTENIFYTDAGYGGYGFGDGKITRTEFLATWHDFSTRKDMGLNKNSFKNRDISSQDSKLCFNTLQKAGYLDEMNHQLNVFYPELEVDLPIICSHGTTGRYIANILGRRGFPEQYGHVYDYGNHQELTKAKYFVGRGFLPPLQPDIFATKVRSLGNTTDSHKIWVSLKRSKYIIEDKDKIDLYTAHGKRGKSFIRSTLADDLRAIKPDFRKYLLNINRLLGFNFSKQHLLSLAEFQKIYSGWKGSNLNKRDQKEAGEIYNMLKKNNYLQNPLSEEFRNALNEYDSNMISDIVATLLKHFAQELGEAEFDVESYGIDANGNHKHYYTGFDRYEISYRNNTNQMKTLKFKSFANSNVEKSYHMEHDSRGNVIQALHKGIKKINYNPVSNRASKVELVDGRVIKFSYDSQGERILKEVINSEGFVTKEVHYIRDESGRCLVERELTFLSSDQAPDLLVTVYIYGPRGLIAFIRRDEFYTLISDHEQSTRLVVKSGEVVAAYDYLPYGNLMREFASYPEAHIRYRYTGQEWDEELGLYNFHARFYDPSIGRFFQTDPKEQYYSPYLYAGNSPVSTVDPDGELAFLIAIIVGAFVGAYLGGAAANKTLNFTKWNWKRGSTWIGIVGGGIGGALLPVGFVGSVGAFGALGLSTYGAISATVALGLGGAYLGAAAENEKWNPGKWDYTSPKTYEGLFSGFAMGSGLPGSFRSVGQFFKPLSARGKNIFLGGTVVSGGVLFPMQGLAANWDFSNPKMWFGVLDVIASSSDPPMLLYGTWRFFAKNGRLTASNFKKIKKFIAQEKKWFSHFSSMKPESISLLKALLLMTVSPLALGLSMYIVGSVANDNNDFKKWDMKSVDTYQALIKTWMSGSQLGSVVQNKFRTIKANKKIKEGERALDAANSAAVKMVKEYEGVLDALRVKLNPKAEYKDATNKQYEPLILNVDTTKYSKNTLDRIKKGNLPNAAVSVYIDGKYIIAAFSTNKAPGYLMIFSHDHLNSASYTDIQPLHKQFLDLNSEIAGRPVTLSDNAARNRYLENSILEVHEGIKQNNIKEFESKEDEMKNALDKLEGISTDAKENIFQNLKNIIYENGYFKGSQNALYNEVKPYFNDVINSEKTKLNGEISERKINMENIKKELNKPDVSQEQIEALKRKLNTLAKELKTKRAESVLVRQELINNRDNVIKEILAPLKGLKKQLPSTSSAEAHVLSAFARREQILTDSGASFNGKSGDLQYLATFKVDEFAPFGPCDHCKISTAHIKNVITDPQWAEKLNKNVLKKLGHLYFLKPFEELFSIKPKTDGGNASNNNRKRRFVRQINLSDDLSVHTPRSIANEEFDFIPVATSTASKSNFYVSDLFDWLKEKWNTLRKITEETCYNEVPKLLVDSDNIFSKRSENSYTKSTLTFDVHGSLLLANVCIAKKFNCQLYNPGSSESITYDEALVNGINITEAFEVEITRTAKEYGLTGHSLDIDFVEVQNAVIGLIMANKLKEIFELLIIKAEKAYPFNELVPSQIAHKEKFIYRMVELINKFVSKSVEHMLDRSTEKRQGAHNYLGSERLTVGTKHAAVSSECPALHPGNFGFIDE